MNMNELGQRAKTASRLLARAPVDVKVAALLSLANNLLNNSEATLKANRMDVEQGKQAGLTPSLLDRLTLKPNPPVRDGG